MIPTGSKDFQALNPHLFRPADEGLKHRLTRIRQSRDRLNKLETVWLAVLSARYGAVPIYSQSLRFRLGNGVWYKPDFVVHTDPWHCYEVKGPKSWRGGFENLKVAATQFPALHWVLVWKDENGGWQEQVVLA